MFVRLSSIEWHQAIQSLNCTVHGFLKSVAYVCVIEYKIADQKLKSTLKKQ